jgi:Zn finger protein HypA/HybF involved in hydrogenase expression
MHELSLSQSILEIARRNTPAGGVLRRVRLRAGPLRAIDRDAMETAWRAVTMVEGAEGVELDLTLEPYRLRCDGCGGEHEAETIEAGCAKGCRGEQRLVGGNELQVTSIVVD